MQPIIIYTCFEDDSISFLNLRDQWSSRSPLLRLRLLLPHLVLHSTTDKSSSQAQISNHRARATVPRSEPVEAPGHRPPPSPRPRRQSPAPHAPRPRAAPRAPPPPPPRRGRPLRRLLPGARPRGAHDPRPRLRVPPRARRHHRHVLRQHRHRLLPYGPYWRQLRKICVVELLSAKRVRGFAALREEEIARALRGISSSASRVNLSERVYALAYAITSRAAFGAECRHLGRFEAAAKRAIKAASGFAVADLFPSLGFLGALTGTSAGIERTHRELDGIIEEIIGEHEEKRERAKKKGEEGEGEGEGEEDLLDVLLRLKEEGVSFDSETPPLTRENVKAVITDMFVAGTDTTATTLAWAMSELLRHPDAMAKAQSELRRSLRGGAAELRDDDVASLHYTKLVVKETLRLHPPLPLLLPRLAREPRRVGGHEIPAGSRVLVSAWAIGRDARRWGVDAEAFRPERFDEEGEGEGEGEGEVEKWMGFEHLAFGAGRRMCPGMGFGMASVEAALANLLCFFDWELPEGTEAGDLDMGELVGAVVGRRSDLWVVAIPYRPI
uniref:Uncharacterized protein n=1 Tax=Ananas comosus var. bracteatus TaxID=296719 RepID=A0A6V7P0W8_ANACO|nr:unnamed protein product [Ananas comosus var. bracteatus]